MLSAELIQKLKQTNISENGDKTKERVERLWKAASAEQKKEVLELADVITATVYRIYRTGSISAKLAVPLAQVLNLDPFYFAGEVDEPGECSDAALRKLLLQHGYSKIVEEANLKRPYTRQQPAAAAAPDNIEVEPEAEALLAPPPQLPPNSDTLVEADYQLLFQALYIQNKAGIPSAKDKLAQIHLMLLS